MDRSFMFHLRQHLVRNDPKTKTEKDQCRTEALVKKAYCEKLEKWGETTMRLFKMEHLNYLTRRLVDLPESIEHLDASQPWLAYWMVHSLRLLCYQLSDKVKTGVVNLMRSCQHGGGGFAGGPYQLAHLAPTYGAVNCLASLLSADALDVIDRQALGDWLISLRQPDGSFVMHHGGEVDVRGAYCAVATASITGVLKSRPEIFQGTAEWIARCQTYEGGFGGQPGLEAHGGYSFCAFAALYLLDSIHLVDVPRLLRWAAHRQMPTEGGFQGRTHKLVDSCYSFWVGAIFPLVEQVLRVDTDSANTPETALFDTSALQEYVLLCCQKVHYTRPGLSVPNNQMPVIDTSGGGLFDKPGKNVDPYHTCYALSGLSVAQHSPRTPDANTVILPDMPFPPVPARDVAGAQWGNELADIDPSLNVVLDAAVFAKTYFSLIDSGAEREVAAQRAIEAADKVSFKQATCDVNSETDDGTVLGAYEPMDHMPNICTSP
ncbi:Protein farnesyltransferase subunit beta [Echinococcus granulosus]|uniref:Protein farnesyltransferase subunit beta n=1 Tax=Echinococcus granulosus TaxID=6210 RepID=W6UVG5_ECHGR|nr:Protein farnesyltransferase subunit beta [Echinococcus granulosus]EUB57429.1 Protein farnesyltransferase subunit beta [Echinococcus granulosus]KAH9281017.1 Protein farnesyltransferase subunit beta [Echinococcus granulosus]